MTIIPEPGREWPRRAPPAPRKPIDQVREVEVPDCVPLFLALEAAKGRKIIWINSKDY